MFAVDTKITVTYCDLGYRDPPGPCHTDKISPVTPRYKTKAKAAAEELGSSGIPRTGPHQKTR